MNKNLENFQIFQSFFFTLNSSNFTNHTTYASHFFTKNATSYLSYFGENKTSLSLLVLKLVFFENYSKFFENKKSKYLQHSTCDVLDRQPLLHESNLCCFTCGMKGVLSRRNTLYKRESFIKQLNCYLFVLHFVGQVLARIEFLL